MRIQVVLSFVDRELSFYQVYRGIALVCRHGKLEVSGRFDSKIRTPPETQFDSNARAASLVALRKD